VDGSGNVYIADTGNEEVEKVTEPGGSLSVVAGSGTEAPTLVGQATLSPLDFPTGVALNASGTILYIADEQSGEVDEVTVPGGELSVFTGGLANPTAVAVDGSGNVYIGTDGPGLVDEVTAGSLSVIARGGSGLPSTTPQTATNLVLNAPRGVAVDSSGNVFIADEADREIYELAPVGPAFTADSPTAAVMGTPYSYTFTASGSPAPTFTATGPLPGGLTLTGAGVLSGTPTGPGTFTVTATNATNFVTTASLPLAPPPPVEGSHQATKARAAIP
jgi:hypothetical protein